MSGDGCHSLRMNIAQTLLLHDDEIAGFY